MAKIYCRQKGLRLPSIKIKQHNCVQYSWALFLENLNNLVWSVPTCLKPFHSLTTFWPMSWGYCYFRSILCWSDFFDCLYPYTKCYYREISSESTNHNICFGDFCKHRIKILKSWPQFFQVTVCVILAICSSNQQMAGNTFKTFGDSITFCRNWN